jgi:hypothetical protein
MTDPRINEFPIPGTADEVIERVVGWVQIFVGDKGGPAFEFERNAAESAFGENWRKFVDQHLKKYPNAWQEQWQNVAQVAERHAQFAFDRAKALKHHQVTTEDFVLGGFKAAGWCNATFRTDNRGCWCNDC